MSVVGAIVAFLLALWNTIAIVVPRFRVKWAHGPRLGAISCLGCAMFTAALAFLFLQRPGPIGAGVARAIIVAVLGGATAILGGFLDTRRDKAESS